ncbi:MAG: hypothetical protein LBR83_02990 [Clostridiales bacterium]|jgi:alpha-tubulin suppressor-like RCC1 family protein|nr:hypothetical protein [Clostridiales bacterium]
MKFKQASLSVGMKYSKYFTLLLGEDNTLWGAGSNFFGQLGTGNFDDCLEATPTGLGGVVSVRAGNLHSAALTEGGSVLGFGLNFAGSLGSLPPGHNPVPKPIPELAGLKIAETGAAGDFTFALTEGGTLYILGSGGVKKLAGIAALYPGANQSCVKTGSGEWMIFENGKEPVPLSGISAAEICEVSVGNTHMAALTSGGRVLCRGDNLSGQLGLGYEVEYSAGFTDMGLTGIVSVASGGSHTLALNGDGAVYAWGFNFFGQLGDGTGERKAPQIVRGLPPAAFIAAGTFNSMIVTRDGEVYGWGGDDFGQLGDSARSQIREPHLLEGLSDIKTACAGLYHTALLTAGGKLYVNGCDLYGQLGDGKNHTGSCRPALVLSGVTDVSAGGTHTAVICEGGKVLAWGNNACGQIGNGRADINPDGKLGNGERRNEPLPVPVPVPRVRMLTSGENHTLYLTLTGEVYAAGLNHFGQLGDGSRHNGSVPLKIPGLKNITEIHAHKFRSAALDKDGKLYCWGYNGSGELGTGDSEPRFTPTLVMDGVEKVILGGWYTLAVKKDATVWAFGMNADGQFGDGTRTGSLTPKEVTPFYGAFKDIAAGGFHTVVLREDGTVWTCGKNEFGELGGGAAGSRNLLTRVQGLKDIESISAGWFCVFAIAKGGELFAFGRNNFGQLFGADTNRYLPVKARQKKEAIV